MTEIIGISTLDKFKQISGYNVSKFFTDYLDFIDREYSNIVNYYTGSSNVAPTRSFNKLKSLIEEQKKLINIFILNAVSLENFEFWALLEYIEDIGHSLETAKNAAKWLRASVTSNGYKRQVVSEHLTSQGQGLEQVERGVVRSNNFRDSWVETALENGMREDDYTLDGGYLIKIIYKNNASLFLEGVVDSIDEPKKTFGLDIDKRIVIENDDLVVLGYEDTIVQCAEILTGLKKNSDPAYPDRGINPKVVVGNSIAGISYPTIFRELAGSFATDDSFRSISVKDVVRDGDAVMLNFTIETKAGLFFDQKLQL